MATLLGEHSSRPCNPSVANAFFRAGEIETWGRGVQRIMDACREAGAPEPSIRYQPGDLWVEFPFAPAYVEALATPVAGVARGVMGWVMGWVINPKTVSCVSSEPNQPAASPNSPAS